MSDGDPVTHRELELALRPVDDFMEGHRHVAFALGELGASVEAVEKRQDRLDARYTTRRTANLAAIGVVTAAFIGATATIVTVLLT